MKSILSLLFFGLLCNKLWAVPVDSNELPSNYVHKSVQAQIKQYREVYDPIMKLPLTAEPLFLNQHVPGLFDILKNGFALVHDQIHKEESDQVQKEDALQELKNLYISACELENTHKFTSYDFIYTNLMTARLIEVRYDKSGFRGGQRPPAFRDGYLQRNFNRKYLEHYVQCIGQPMIIYTNKSSKISTETFVDQILHSNYRANLMLFDIHSRRQPQTLGSYSPHGGDFDGTYSLLLHDLVHTIEQAEIEDTAQDKFEADWIDPDLPELKGLSLLLKQKERIQRTRADARHKNFWISHLRQINILRASLNKSSIEYKTLTDALFLCSHDFFNITANSFSANVSTSCGIPFSKNDFFMMMLDATAKLMITNFSKMYEPQSSKYNGGYKDYESMMKKFEKDIKDRKEQLIDAYHRFWAKAMMSANLAVTKTEWGTYIDFDNHIP